MELQNVANSTRKTGRCKPCKGF